MYTYLSNKWNNNWHNLSIKLNRIKNDLNPWINLGLNRKEEIVINQLRIDHTQLTVIWWSKQNLIWVKHVKKNKIKYYTLNIIYKHSVLLTINHIIIKCQIVESYRNQFHISDQICQVLGPNIISFLWKSELYNFIKHIK